MKLLFLCRYREAGAEVIAIFSKFCSCVERASVDEAYLDLTMEVTQRMTAMAESQVKDVQLSNTFVEAYDGADGKTLLTSILFVICNAQLMYN